MVSVTEGNAWVRDRENLREISRCAHLERKEVTCGRSNPDHPPADHPWLSQGWSQAKRSEKWALVREKIAVRPRPPLRTRVGEATQRGLILAGRREAPHVASTGGAEAAIPLSPRTVKRRVGPVKTSLAVVYIFRVQPPLQRENVNPDIFVLIGQPYFWGFHESPPPSEGPMGMSVEGPLDPCSKVHQPRFTRAFTLGLTFRAREYLPCALHRV